MTEIETKWLEVQARHEAAIVKVEHLNMAGLNGSALHSVATAELNAIRKEVADILAHKSKLMAAS